MFTTLHGVVAYSRPEAYAGCRAYCEADGGKIENLSTVDSPFYNGDYVSNRVRMET